MFGSGGGTTTRSASGSSSGELVIVHKADVPPGLVLDSATFSLEGRPVTYRVDEAKLAGRSELEVLRGRFLSGEHRLVVNYLFLGTSYGVFSYHQGYRYKLRKVFPFTLKPDHRVVISVAGQNRSGATSKPGMVPTIQVDLREEKLTAGVASVVRVP
jgi:hypothetical protein